MAASIRKSILFYAFIHLLLPDCDGYAIKVHGKVEMGDEVANFLKNVYHRFSTDVVDRDDNNALIGYISKFLSGITIENKDTNVIGEVQGLGKPVHLFGSHNDDVSDDPTLRDELDNTDNRKRPKNNIIV